MSPYFIASVVVLALLLSFPVTQLIWVLSVRRLQARTHRELDGQELRGQRNRARLLALVVALIFSCLFNLYLGGALGYG